MKIETTRARSVEDTRTRILDVALDVLGESPESGMGEIASAAGVVRRTVYGHFPTRADLVRTLTQRAVDEMAAVLEEVDVAGRPPETVWADFIARLWPLMHRYRVLLVFRRGEHGPEIHDLLGSVDRALADLVRKGQESNVFGRHLPAQVLSQVAYAAVFAIADNDLAGEKEDVSSAAITSLLILGVPEARARTLVSPSD